MTTATMPASLRAPAPRGAPMASTAPLAAPRSPSAASTPPATGPRPGVPVTESTPPTQREMPFALRPAFVPARKSFAGGVSVRREGGHGGDSFHWSRPTRGRQYAEGLGFFRHSLLK